MRKYSALACDRWPVPHRTCPIPRLPSDSGGFLTLKEHHLLSLRGVVNRENCSMLKTKVHLSYTRPCSEDMHCRQSPDASRHAFTSRLCFFSYDHSLHLVFLQKQKGALSLPSEKTPSSSNRSLFPPFPQGLLYFALLLPRVQIALVVASERSWSYCLPLVLQKVVRLSFSRSQGFRGVLLTLSE